MTTIKYGVSGQFAKAFEATTTVGELIADKAVLAMVGAPESVTAISGGETLGTGELINNYSTITLEKKAASKA